MSRLSVGPWERAVNALDYEHAVEAWRDAELDAALAADQADDDECGCGACQLCDTSDPGVRR